MLKFKREIFDLCILQNWILLRPDVFNLCKLLLHGRNALPLRQKSRKLLQLLQKSDDVFAAEL